jgi:hypothetical protein
MKVFISSVVGGFEHFRDAAAAAVRSLGHHVVRAEDFGASPASPQSACLAGVRDADVVLLLLGERYGEPQAAGLSATHEEYREARDADKVLVFVQGKVAPEPAQASLIDEVRGWEGGHYTASFTSPQELRDAVTRDLHRLELARSSTPADPDEVAARAAAAMDAASAHGDALDVAVAGGPRTAVIRPSDLSGQALRDLLAETAVTGASRLFPIEGSSSCTVVRGRLTFEHRLGGISVDEFGTVVVRQPTRAPREGQDWGLRPLVHEDVEARIASALRFVADLLDKIDPAGKMGSVVPMVQLDAGATSWMTRQEASAMSNTMTLNVHGAAGPVHLTPPARRRTALAADADGLARDLTELLRRVAVSRPF